MRVIRAVPDMVLNLRTIMPPHEKLLLAKEEEAVTEPVRRDAPTWTGEVRSVRANVANLIAPSIFSSPAPCSSVPKPLNLWAEYSIKALTMFGVSFGLSWSIRAAVPAAIRVETEVPLICIILMVAAVPLVDAFRDGFEVIRRLS